MIDSISRVLAWRDSESPSQLYGWYIDALGATLGQVLRNLSSRGYPIATSLSNELLLLPHESLLRLIVAPETYHRITADVDNQPDAVIDFLSVSLEAEQCRLDDHLRASRPVWSALGDAYFPKGTERRSPESALLQRPNRAFFAPSLQNIVPADFHSPHAKAPFEPGLGRPAKFTETELVSVTSRLESALEAIGLISPASLSLIALFTKQIVLRKDSAHPDRFRAFSRSDFMGRVTILNPQLERWDKLTLADQLLHEAMHSFLFAIEFKEGPFVKDMEEAWAVKTSSPWTGFELDLHAYIHASFVWFGLFQFWTLAKKIKGFHKEQVRELANAAAKGFRKEKLTNFPAARDVMRPEVVKLIDDMQRTVRTTQR
ncbi:MAG TPA: HEXXH motif-containing putative peptide modification protein [Pyrinomonadaceae bacterium]|nr:HEXXH motif-containing putative peptide modification protein [Pyrinomonadaceae bacterium]